MKLRFCLFKFKVKPLLPLSTLSAGGKCRRAWLSKMPDVCRSRKRVSEALELQLQQLWAAVCVLGIEPRTPAGAVSVLNHGAMSLAHYSSSGFVFVFVKAGFLFVYPTYCPGTSSVEQLASNSDPHASASRCWDLEVCLTMPSSITAF